MRILFLHQNFPGQYKHLLAALAGEPDNEVLFITQRANAPIAGVKRIVYRPARPASRGTHPYVHPLEAAVLNGQAVYRVATKLKQSGYRPDIVIGHNGWGETLYVKDAFSDTQLLSYFEFFYKSQGTDIDFDPEYLAELDTRLRTHTLNAVNFAGLNAADWGQTATSWQKSQYPAWSHSKMSVVHEGIDSSAVVPDPQAYVTLNRQRIRLTRKDEVITYVARNLEPYRGFHAFMRALPSILKRRPNARVLIVGGNEVSYGAALRGTTYRARLVRELDGRLDFSRVHFLGRLPYEAYLKVLQISSAHVYLTYPFVLSWSMLEAMAAGCLIIGSRTPPVEEVLRHGDNGLLVDFFSTEAIADAVEAVLEHPDRMQALRERARRTVIERYDLKSICLPRQLEIIDALVERRRPPLAAPAPRRASEAEAPLGEPVAAP